MPKGHYWLLVLGLGKDQVERVYVPMEHEDETSDEAVERWVSTHPTMVNRQRNRDKQASKLRASILYTQDARPTSWRVERQGEPEGRSVRRR